MILEHGFLSEESMKSFFWQLTFSVIMGGNLLLAGVNGTVPEIKAVRADEEITIDGNLEENVWKREGYSQLIQRDPNEGEKPTEKTDVWIAYSDQGLYVAGSCYHTTGDSIAGGLARRDENVESDWFWFWIDTNNDRQSAFGFAVNPDGSIIDQRLYQDIYEDSDWDGLWEAAALKKDGRWTFEIFIPFSQLRFGKRDEYVWGVNFKRYILANAEDDYFAMVPKAETGFVSRFGRLTGIKGIRPPGRLFVSPYVMGKVNDQPGISESAFRTDLRYGKNVGLDVKYGLSGNLTLDLAVNPDFGQAEADPAVINLSAFETYYQEKRAFFIEGSDIFRFGANPTGGVWGCYWREPTIFYSRRIGRRPQGNAVHEGEVYTPEQTTILGAAKVSGKVGNWSLGSITALTQREYTTVDSAGIRFEDPIEPMSFYSVFRGLREFHDGDQGLGFIFTGVTRKQDELQLTSINNTHALAGGLDGWTFLGKERNWAFIGKMVYSRIQGTEERIARVQQSSTHYFQRPDLESENLDTTRTTLSGYMGRFGLKNMKGNWQFQTALGVISPGFNVADMGYISHGNVINAHVVLGYRWLKPTSWYRQIYLFGMTSRNFDFDGNRLFSQYYLALSTLFLNYMSLSGNIQFTPEGLDLYQTRGGPIMAYPGYLYSQISFGTDTRRPVQFRWSTSYRSARDGSYTFAGGPGLVLKPLASLRLSLSLGYTKALDHQQWVYNVEDASALYGAHYVFADIDYQELDATFRMDWGVTPRLSVQAYIQPYIAAGNYSGFKELAEARTYNFLPYDFTLYDPDFNFKSFQSNLVFRWEYSPGSLLYLVWTHNRDNTDHPGSFRLGRDLRSLFRERSHNIFFIKFSYMLSVI
jgi:hypothetical protein